jgi:hypothetical protein
VTRRELWQAPAENGGLLIDPPPERAPELLEKNRQRLNTSKVTLLGRPLDEIRGQIQDSLATIHQATMISPHGPKDTWPVAPTIVSGHQPELYHPGVWIKNFAINGLARRNHAAPLHVVVDSDTVKSTSIHLPNWRTGPIHVSLTSENYDAWEGEVPFLGREIHDPARFRSFPDQSKSVWGDWPFRPILPEFWQEAVRTYEATVERLREKYQEDSSPTLMWCLARPRQLLEQKWGCLNREQWLCMFDRQAFIGQILADLPRFHAAYNDSVRAYRRKYRLRSASHPMPDLSRDGDYFEAPFWWVEFEPSRRHRLFVRAHADRLELRPGRNGKPVPVPRDSPFAFGMVGGGAEIVTRALTTTMFIRLCVADLFIHGIGGAKYDEVTDDVIREYFGIEPPEYMVVSGTLRLPFPAFPCTPAERHRLQRGLRDLQWNPERHLSPSDPKVADLVAEKDRWRAKAPQDKAGRRERFRRLQQINLLLREPLPASLLETQRQWLDQCDQEMRANDILRRRDYAFVLHPEETLRSFLMQVM